MLESDIRRWLVLGGLFDNSLNFGSAGQGV